MEENLEPIKEVNNEISDVNNTSNSEEEKDTKSEKNINLTANNVETQNNSENIKNNNEVIDSEEDSNPNVEMPPQRDIRDSQPTISVNYRVVQNGEENYSKSDQNSSEKPANKNDLVNDVNDW